MYYFVTLLFVILSAKAAFFDLSNICWVLIDVLILWVGFERGRFTRGDVRLFSRFAIIYIAFCTFRSVFLTGLPMRFWMGDIVFLFKYVLTSFLYCALMKDRALHYLTKVMIDLAIISLPLFCVQLISPKLVFSLGKMINLPHAHFYGYVNFLVFTYVDQHPNQNSGFSWEPGAFGFFLNMTLLLYFSINNFKFDKKAWWLSVAIITTLSTTTYVAFMFIILLYFRARGVPFAKLLFFIGPLLCIAAVSLPFLLDKIVVIYNRDMSDMKNIDTLDQWYVEHGQSMPLNRFASLLFLWQTFGFRLTWGMSNLFDETVPILKSISISNGIFAFLAQFGIIGLGYLVQKTFVLFRKLSGRIEISIYGIVIILIFGFAECIFITSLILCFLFLYHYAQPEAPDDYAAAPDGYLEEEGVYQISAETSHG